MKKIGVVFCSILVLFSIFSLSSVSSRLNAEEINDIEIGNPVQDDYFYVIDENGDIEFIEYDDYEYDESKDKEVESQMNLRNSGGTDYHVAMIKGYTTYTEATTGLAGYTHGNSATDAAYIQTNSNGTIRIKQSGVVMDVPASSVNVVKYTDQKISTYTTSNGKLYHNYLYNQTSTATTWVGYQQSYMSSNATYYSYDGHYFYTSYVKMIDDYRNGNYNNSINPKSPYYNYYQYLSHRSSTKFNASMFNKRITDVKGAGTNSKLKDAGESFLTSQNTYGVNASLMWAVSINESGWGLSSYALNRNNLFGHKAYDSSPDSAASYSSILEGINVHANQYISSGYLNPGDYRYRGSHLGDKQSGINVKYASDPYWGEKAASQLYYLNESNGKIDYGLYSIGIVDGDVSIYNNTSSSKKSMYGTGSGSNKALINNVVVIIGQETGSDGSLYYKIQSDTPLNTARTAINPSGIYSYTRDYAYIKASAVNVVSNGSSIGTSILDKLGLRENNGYVIGFKVGTSVSSFIQSIKSADSSAFVNMKNTSGADINSGTISTGMTFTLKESGNNKTYTIVVKGDVNGDGAIYATDYVKVKNYIMGNTTLNNAYLQAADVNSDGRVYATDYVIIKNYIMGNGSIEQ